MRLASDDIRDLASCDKFTRESASEFCATCGYTNLDHLRRHARNRTISRRRSMNEPISDERLAELYEIFAERAATPTTGMKEDIDVMRALAELQERRTARTGGSREA